MINISLSNLKYKTVPIILFMVKLTIISIKIDLILKYRW